MKAGGNPCETAKRFHDTLFHGERQGPPEITDGPGLTDDRISRNGKIVPFKIKRSRLDLSPQKHAET